MPAATSPRWVQAFVAHCAVIGPPIDVAGSTARVDAHDEEGLADDDDTRLPALGYPVLHLVTGDVETGDVVEIPCGQSMGEADLTGMALVDGSRTQHLDHNTGGALIGKKGVPPLRCC